MEGTNCTLPVNTKWMMSKTGGGGGSLSKQDGHTGIGTTALRMFVSNVSGLRSQHCTIVSTQRTVTRKGTCRPQTVWILHSWGGWGSIWAFTENNPASTGNQPKWQHQLPCGASYTPFELKGSRSPASREMDWSKLLWQNNLMDGQAAGWPGKDLQSKKPVSISGEKVQYMQSRPKQCGGGEWWCSAEE